VIRLPISALALVGVIGFAIRRPVHSETALMGVWRVAEARDASGRDITDRQQRTLFIWTRRHLAIVWSDIVRPHFRPPLSDSQKVAMWQGFGAQEGTYEFADDTITLHSEIAKSPEAMATGAFQKFRVELLDRVMWLTLVADNTGPLPNQERLRLIRIE
jgi:hypothetical protein